MRTFTSLTFVLHLYFEVYTSSVMKHIEVTVNGMKEISHNKRNVKCNHDPTIDRFFRNIENRTIEESDNT